MKTSLSFGLLLISFCLALSSCDTREDDIVPETYPYFYETSFQEYSKAKIITSNSVIEDKAKIEAYLTSLNTRFWLGQQWGDNFELNESKIELKEKETIAKRISNDSILIYKSPDAPSYQTNMTGVIRIVKHINNTTYWELPDSFPSFQKSLWNNLSAKCFKNMNDMLRLHPLYESQTYPLPNSSGYVSYRMIKSCIYIIEKNNRTYAPICNIMINAKTEFNLAICSIRENNILKDNQAIQSILSPNDTVLIQESRIYLTKSEVANYLK